MNRFTVAVLSLLVGASAFAANKKASINIDGRVQYQHVTGFGGFSPSPTWSYWLGETEMNKLFGKADNQLGLNVLRLYIANNKSAWSAGVANAKNAKKNGAFIFATTAIAMAVSCLNHTMRTGQSFSTPTMNI